LVPIGRLKDQSGGGSQYKKLFWNRVKHCVFVHHFLLPAVEYLLEHSVSETGSIPVTG